ncbi:MAG: leucine--tRNA ligase [Sphingobacteriales bacterium]|nr:MAG: leucine--tRNA ligase [Sphingobacteriales bacterium]
MDYQFKSIEQKWQQYWATNQTFKVATDTTKPKYYVLDMFPYPSGAGLHVGHPLGYIASDIFARYKRIKGFNVLHPMGYDSFGLPAEQYAIQTGQHPAITTEANIARYRQQLDNLGFSFDWSREVRTSNADYYKWTQWIFMQIFNSWYNLETDKAEPISTLVLKLETVGTREIKAVCDDDVQNLQPSDWSTMNHLEKEAELLKYRLTFLKESTVNWCPVLGTVLANDEIKEGFSERGGHPVEQKKMMQWSMRITAYAERLLQGLNTIDWPEPLKEIQRNWIGKSVGAMVKFPLAPKGGTANANMLGNINVDTPPLGAGGNKPRYLTGGNYSHILLDKAKEMRKTPTNAENILWLRLKSKALEFKFRQQHLIDNYIVDFVCISKGLVVEVDGEIHNSQLEYDAERTKILNQVGFKVIRFTNQEVIDNIDKVLSEIERELNTLNPPQPPEGGSANPPNPQRGDANANVHGEINVDTPPSGAGGIEISVFTTRVDTLYGVTYLAIAPEHELVAQLTTPQQKESIDAYIAQTKKKSELDRMADVKTVSGAFTGSYVTNPINGAQVPVWIADYVLAGYGTGAVMAVPSGDQRDYLFAQHFNLPIIPILDAQQIDTQADPTKEGKYINSGIINGLTYKQATTVIIDELEKLDAGKAKINYRMRDAIFGRQRYWGEPVPVYFKDGLPYLIDESELPLVLPEVDKYLPTQSGEPPLGRAQDWKYKHKYDYELSTMPGWAGSSWYWFRYMDAQNNQAFADKKSIAYWQDVDLYIGGSEHATGHLLYSRFWNKFLKDLGYVTEEEPFKKLINQGMIQGRSSFVYRLVDDKGKPTHTFVSFGLKNNYKTIDTHVDVNIVENDILDIEKFKASRDEYANAKFIFESGKEGDSTLSFGEGRGEEKYICGHEVEKMSKSKFNVVNPDDLVDRYGADTLRMYEMFLGPLEQSKPWNTNGIEGVFKFLRKFWKLFHDDSFTFKVSDQNPAKAELKALHKIIKKVEDDVERFSFNTSVSSFMIAVNELTDLKCDKKEILQDMVIVLSPYAPHICEELWALLGNTNSVSTATYPTFNPQYLVEDNFNYPISINGKTKTNISLPLTMEAADVELYVLQSDLVTKYFDGKTPKKVIVVKGRIVNVVL